MVKRLDILADLLLQVDDYFQYSLKYSLNNTKEERVDYLNKTPDYNKPLGVNFLYNLKWRTYISRV